ncbi:MAG TPA: UDP-N-acetylglucosamine 2-epimerase (non-hydrolyzing), partial [Candidatus Methylomirabilis sp.]|nr:UDP-N-acetylglucosamine 2-epimerase (non-hydrolyzing) [Candidatus Methylomirabilis sp.]
ERARQNLLREGVADERIMVTGNPVIDALQWVAAQAPSPQACSLLRELGIDGEEGQGSLGAGATERLSDPLRPNTPAPRLIFVTAHRRENFGAPLQEICLALRELATSYRDRLRILYAVHMNPNVSQPVHRLLGGLGNVTLTPPLDYLSTVHLLKHAYLVLTDSGGLQEEAPGLGKPVLVLRELTERPEGVEAGTARIVGVKREDIVRETVRLLKDHVAYAAMARAVNPYGDGKARHRIVQGLLKRGGNGREAP